MEVPAGACFEAMAARRDVDSSRIAIDDWLEKVLASA
jgi:hypothetical protein